jgi:hypothetical protein
MFGLFGSQAPQGLQAQPQPQPVPLQGLAGFMSHFHVPGYPGAMRSPAQTAPQPGAPAAPTGVPQAPAQPQGFGPSGVGPMLPGFNGGPTIFDQLMQQQRQQQGGGGGGGGFGGSISPEALKQFAEMFA